MFFGVVVVCYLVAVWSRVANKTNITGGVVCYLVAVWPRVKVTSRCLAEVLILVTVWPRVAAENNQKKSNSCQIMVYLLYAARKVTCRCLAEVTVCVVCYLVAVWSRVANKKKLVTVCC